MAFGLCLSDFKPTPDICPILGCPLIEGKEYVVNILKKIPPLPFVSICCQHSEICSQLIIRQFTLFEQLYRKYSKVEAYFNL